MSNPYAPPIHDEGEDERPIGTRRRSAQFFRVSPSTLALLYLVTFGIYGLYWFYKHWAVQKRAWGLNVSPLARGIFSIFFVHRLFKRIDQTARATGASPRWKPDTQATMYVLMVIIARVILRLDSGSTGLLVGIVLSAAAVIPLVEAQRVANLANGHSLDGETWIDG